MGLGTALVLFAIGAILTFAVEVDSASGFNINNIGVILMIVGMVGGLLSLLFWNTWGGFGNNGRTVRVVESDRPDVIVEERPVRRRVIREEEVI